MKYEVEITERARKDLDAIVRNLSERSPKAARRLSARFEMALSRLETFPFGCALAHENRSFGEELRNLLFGISRKRKFRALFVVRDADVVVLAIRAPGERSVRPDDLAT
jgi:plasmid stabilization system protein ParE